MVAFAPELRAFLETKGIPFLGDISLREYTYARTGGVASYVLLPASLDSLRDCLMFLGQHEIDYKTIGATTNTLFLDERTYGVLLSLQNMSGILFDENGRTVTVDAGCMLNDFVLSMAGHSVKGFENLIGIPGTIGGAVYMNAGSFRCEIADNLISVTIVTPAGKVAELGRDALHMGWRHSAFQEKNLGIIVRATFDCPAGNSETIRHQMTRWQDWRDAYLESQYPNLGSIFATKDIYQEIANRHRAYRTVLWVFRKLVLRNDRPRNGTMLARLTASFFGFKRLGLPYSEKGINTFVNRGNTSSNEILAYIDVLRELTGGAVKLENEIVTAPTLGEEEERQCATWPR